MVLATRMAAEELILPADKPKSLSRDQASIIVPVLLLALAAFFVAYQFVDPAPPKSISIATGAKTGAYYNFGTAYQDLFAREDVQLIVRETAGSTDNVELLRSGAVDVAFVQGGVDGDPAAVAGLQSLGSLYFEPLWVFHTLETDIDRLPALDGARLAVGSTGSGTRPVALRLLALNNMSEESYEQHDIGGQHAVEALLNNEIDAMFVVASPRSEVVAQLLHEPTVRVMNFARAQAYVRSQRYLSHVTLPEGVVDFELNIPNADKILLAPAATLVATQALHPALIDLLLQTAAAVHIEGGLFEAHGQFPSPEYTEFPMSAEATRFYRSGPPFLQRFLPFWAATLIDRLWVMAVPFLALLIPLMRIMPPVYRWRIRLRIYRWYRQLLELDPVVNEQFDTSNVAQRLVNLEVIEQEVGRVHVPLSYADQLYHLRLHIEYVRVRLEERLEQAGKADSTPA